MAMLYMNQHLLLWGQFQVLCIENLSCWFEKYRVFFFWKELVHFIQISAKKYLSLHHIKPKEVDHHPTTRFSVVLELKPSYKLLCATLLASLGQCRNFTFQKSGSSLQGSLWIAYIGRQCWNFILLVSFGESFLVWFAEAFAFESETSWSCACHSWYRSSLVLVRSS
jgi:hypothetical protein